MNKPLNFSVAYSMGYWRVFCNGISIKKYMHEASAVRYVAARQASQASGAQNGVQS